MIEIQPPARLEQIFLHFFDIHFLEEKGRSIAAPILQAEMVRATKLAVASASQVLIPAASYFESSICKKIVDDLAELQNIAAIMLVGSAPNVEEFIRERADASYYGENSAQSLAYRSALNFDKAVPYVRRQSNTTADIVAFWDGLVQSGNFVNKLHSPRDFPLSKDFEKKLELVPARLERTAFISEHVYPLLDLPKDQKGPLHWRLRDVINDAYFKSYLEEYQAGIVLDLLYLSSNLAPLVEYNLSYRRMIQHVRRTIGIETFDNLSPMELFALGDQLSWQLALLQSPAYVGGSGGTQGPVRTQNSERIPNLMKKENNILILTVSSSELAAVTSYLNGIFGLPKLFSVEGDAKTYVNAYEDTTSKAVWYVAKSSFQGEAEITAYASELKNALSPAAIFMIGMCMGMPKGKMKPGDVLIPNEVVLLDHERVTEDKNEFRGHQRPVDTKLYKLAELVISGMSSNGFSVFTSKGLASASKKVEFQTAELLKHIEASYPDVLAYDMEGAGFYRGLKHMEHSLWIKAVADLGEKQGTSTEEQENKTSAQRDVTENALKVGLEIGKNYLAMLAGK